MTLTATCCCGDLAIEVAGEPVLNGVCHCANCKRRTGSAFGWSVYFPDDAMRVLRGDGELYSRESATGRQDRYFCGGCGSTLYWRAAAFPGNTDVAGGCFEPGAIGEPTLTASNDGRCAWIGLPEACHRAP